MPIRYGPSGQLKDLQIVDIAPGPPGQTTVLVSSPAGVVGWTNPPLIVSPWGSIADGNLVVAPGTFLADETWANMVTFAAGGTLDLFGFPLHCRTLDLRNTIAGAIQCVGLPGAPGAAGAGGVGGLPHTVAANYTILQGGTHGGIGGNAGFDGGGAWGTTDGPGLPSPCGNGGNGGAGGNSATQVGAPQFAMIRRRFPYLTSIWQTPAIAAVGSTNMGGGSGGGGGAGSATAGGGGGGGGAGVAAIFAQTIIVDATTAPGAILLTGAAGAAGEAGAAPGDNGGGGGAGGAGGWLYLVYFSITGAGLAPTAIDLSGAAGDAGGNGNGAGAGGAGGDGGNSGYATFVDLSAGTVTEHLTVAGAAGGAPVGAVGGAGGAGGVLIVGL